MIRKELHAIASGRHNRARQRALNSLRKQYPNQWLQEYRKAEREFALRFNRRFQELKRMHLDDIVIEDEPEDFRIGRVVTADVSQRRYKCPTCGAAQWKPCRTPAGHWTKLHHARLELLRGLSGTTPRDITCPKCFAPVGSACRTNNKTHKPHKERVEAAWEAFGK